MIRYAAICLLVAIVALLIVLFGNILVGGAVWIAQIAFAVFIVLFVVFLWMDIRNRRKKK